MRPIIILIFLFFFHQSDAQNLKNKSGSRGHDSKAKTQSVIKLDKTKISTASLDRKIRSLMKAANVQGLAIAVFNRNEPVYKKTFGYKRLDTKEPIKTSTNFYGASLSKAVFAVLVMKLVEEGVLDLDKPLQDYLPKPIFEYTPTKKWHDNYGELRNDSLYKKITARMCLDHTSGFANWRWDEPDQKLKVNFQPGLKYSYSGEGLVYLQVVLENMLDKSLEELMKEKIFNSLGMNMSSYTWQPKFEKDYVIGHSTTGELYEKDKDNDARSASTLETTLDDYTLFTKAVLKNSILKPSSTKEMFTPQIKLRSIQQFGPLRFRDSSANDAIQLSYGLGWVLLQSPYGTGAFKEGHGDGFQHYSIIFPKQGTGIILMSNSDNAESIFKELLETAIGDIFTPWYWENYIPYNARKDIRNTMDGLFTSYIDSGFSGSVLISEKNKITLKKGYGYANNEQKIINTPETLFNVASIGKQFTSYSILLLEKQGLLSTNDFVSKFIGSFNDIRDSVTIHHLLLHSSGLFKEGANLDYSTRKLFIQSVKDTGSESKPGEKYRYSNAGYSMLAAIVEIVSDQPFEYFLKENIFKPCKMENTGYPWEPRLNKKIFATGYDENKKAMKPQEDLWAARGPGNLVTTMEDLYKWIIAIQDTFFMPKAMTDKIFYDYIPGRETYSWNKNKTIRNTRFFHKGGGRADFESQVMWYPDDNAIIIFSINNDYNVRRILFSKIRAEMN